MKLNEKEFDKIVKRAIRRIPREIQRHLDNLQISVRRRPTRKMLKEMEVPPDETLFGVFSGVPLSEQSLSSPPLFPGMIILFQEPLQEACATIGEMEEEIEITVVHEIAHAIGISEERLAELGYE